jgi:two-component system chemotaxis response regulator CheY
MSVSEKRQTIVIADDDAFLREMLRLLLRSDDYEVIGEAANGAVAFDLCRKLRPDVALLDINMPVKDGLSVLEELKSLNCPSR